MKAIPRLSDSNPFYFTSLQANTNHSYYNQQIGDKEEVIDKLQRELDNMQQSQRGLKEDLAEREGQLRVTKMNLQAAQKQNNHHSNEVNRF